MIADPNRLLCLRAEAKWSLVVFSLLLLTAAKSLAAPVTLTDDRGMTIQLAGPARRIVTLAPNLTELSFAAGAGSALVGVSDFSDAPPEAKRLPVVASANGVDIERLLALKPDLVLAWKSGNRPVDVKRIEELGIPVIATEPQRIGDVSRIVRLIGLVSETSAVADASATAFDSEVATLRNRYGGRREVTVFYQVWERPLVTVGGVHLIDEVIRFCGGRNVFGEVKLLAPEVSIESVIAADPQVILIGGAEESGNGRWAQLPTLRAVAHGNAYRIDATRVERASPRLTAGIAEVCEKLERAR